MVKQRKEHNSKNRNSKGFNKDHADAGKINASTGYEICTEQLSPFGGLLALIKFLDLIGFKEIIHSAYQAPLREPKPGHYRMMTGILMLLFIGFNRVRLFQSHPASSSRHILAVCRQPWNQPGQIVA